MSLTADERFDVKWIPEPNSGCWLWLAGVNDRGYGKFRLGNRMVRAHRYSYERAKGPIPEGLEPDHTCRTPACVNPDHLEPVTHRENCLRGEGPQVTRARKGSKARCVNGHEFTPENTYVFPDGRRACRTCQREHMRAYRARKKAAA